ncbi:hypothetical protein NPIL_301941 [Nephila pilipes]|uniref:Uncharacterized protein n=1 Tax=Nephila pilipes TaxID=299642 RepID=A0A8X6PLH1_NEPPI|nr:hypothetical protein NPIL_301941 [Nephila pilipes]
MPVPQFIVSLAVSMITLRKENANAQRKKTGRPSNASKLVNVGDHLSTERSTRKRCVRNVKDRKGNRTKTVCAVCKTELFKNHFAFRILHECL